MSNEPEPAGPDASDPPTSTRTALFIRAAAPADSATTSAPWAKISARFFSRASRATRAWRAASVAATSCSAARRAARIAALCCHCANLAATTLPPARVKHAPNARRRLDATAFRRFHRGQSRESVAHAQKHRARRRVALTNPFCAPSLVAAASKETRARQALYASI